MRRALVRVLAAAVRRQDRIGVAEPDAPSRGVNRGFTLEGRKSKMSNIGNRAHEPALNVLLSQRTISRRSMLLSSLGGAVGLAIEAGRRPVMAAEGPVTSLTYSGQRW